MLNPELLTHLVILVCIIPMRTRREKNERKRKRMNCC